MRETRAAAENAALEGLMSSPDTQTCAAIFQAAVGSQSETNDYASINTPFAPGALLSSSKASRSRHNLNFHAPEFEVHDHLQQGRRFATRNTAHLSLDPSRLLTSTSFPNNDNAHLNFSAPPDALFRKALVDVALSQSSTTVRRDNKGRLRLFRADGTEADSEAKSKRMENIVSQLYGSDSSDLSTTQENDPSAYAKLYEIMAAGGFPTSPSSGHTHLSRAQDPPRTVESAATAVETGMSYAAHETGHLTLDYQPPPQIPMHESFDEADIEDASNKWECSDAFKRDVVDPRTPAQHKLVIGPPGTVMGLSQMFAETQPSPRSRGRQLVAPSSSRPSPDLYNMHQLPKDIASSPLYRRGGKSRSLNAGSHNVSSSPSHIAQDLAFSDQPTILPSATEELFISASLILRNLPQPYDAYTSRKESQERRRQQAITFDDGSQTSDDGFSDDEAKMNRRAKLKKEEAARELAFVRTSRPVSAGNDTVEVPSTNGRRRSVQEDYIAQCSGLDARDTQPDATIADSQSAPADPPALTSGNGSPVMPSNELGSETPNNLFHSRLFQKDSALSPKTADLRSSMKIPQFEQNRDSEATESDREASKSPVRRPVPQPLMEFFSNIGELRTPVVHKTLPLPEGDAMVPETSPPEAHQGRYGIIVSQSPPLPSAENVDIFNPFTQDSEFNAILKSPSPQRKTRSRSLRFPNTTGDAKTEANSGCSKESRATEKPGVGSIHVGIDIRPAREAEDTDSTHAAPEEASEYVTAPTNLPFESLGHLATEKERKAYEGDILIQTAEKAAMGSAAANVSEDNILEREVAERPAEVPELKHHGLRSADKLKGSSSALRRLTEDNDGGSIIMTPSRTAPAPTAKKAARSSRRASINPSDKSSDKVKSAEPEKMLRTIVLKRRKVTPTKPVVSGLFSGMAFSVSYVNREGEKKEVLRLIKQNGGRLLERGFDELFDITASEVNSPAKNTEAGNESEGSDLKLTAEARQVGFTCLIADEHSRKVKFMQALALGLPCLSGRWIEHCVAKDTILDWDPYLLAAGESSFLGGAVHSRNLQSYPATTAKFANHFRSRQKLLSGRSILLIMGKGRVLEKRKKAYMFLTQALGAQRVKRVQSNHEARKALLEAESNNEEWSWVYVDEEEDAENAIFGTLAGGARKRKRGSAVFNESDAQGPPPKKIRIVSDEYVIQSLILGKLLE